ncbi:MAG TPA: hypothetical protein VHR97_03335 [Candidatus Baltobacteraceae bacterium]|jgi:hypothetical protein|nr:hypothetical protein [Candidatus Baltobacteraceae bacterium]
MREIARVALQQKLSYGELARRLNALDGLSRSTKNVSEHFWVKKRPRDKTIAAYATILGLSATHIALLCGKLLSGEEAKEVLVSGAVRFLLLKSTHFKKSTAEKVKSVIASMLRDNPEEARRIASRVALAGYREAVGLSDDIATKYPEFAEQFGFNLTVVADALKGTVNLFDAPGRRDRRLARIWVDLFGFPLEERDYQRVINHIVRLLKKQGIDTKQMEATLHEVQTNLTEGLSIPTRVPLMSDFDV